MGIFRCRPAPDWAPNSSPPGSSAPICCAKRTRQGEANLSGYAVGNPYRAGNPWQRQGDA